MQRTSTVGVGFVGCGNVAVNRHLPALQSLQDASVVALADANRERLEWAADRFHVARRCGEYRALIDDPAVAVVAVCTPAQLHAEIALAALDAGKHAFIEKPLALSLDECDLLVERAARSSYKVMVGFNMRWHRLVRQARAIVVGGQLGTLKAIRYVTASQHGEHEPAWLRHSAQGGGMIMEHAVHAFDLWRFLLQSEVEEVFALSRPGHWEDETVTITARMANGVLTTALLSKGGVDNHEVELYGEKGRMSLCRYRWDGLQVHPASSFPSGIQYRLRGALNTLSAMPHAIPSIRQGGDLIASFRAEWRAFLDAIRLDTPVGCTLEDGRQAVRVALAAMASAASQCSVRPARAPRGIAQLTG